MVPYKCYYFSARSAQGRIQGGAKIGQRGSPSSRNFFRQEGYDLEACGKKCCYFWFHSEVKIFDTFWRLFGLSHFSYFNAIFIRPSSDGTYYGMVMSVRPGLRPSGSPSVRPFSAFFSNILWHIELKFCTWLCFNLLQVKFECRHFASVFEGVMPLCKLRI